MNFLVLSYFYNFEAHSSNKKYRQKILALQMNISKLNQETKETKIIEHFLLIQILLDICATNNDSKAEAISNE